ncbi:BAG family molecular chaperone regulator 2 isoform X3 [Bactrocera neohumeralis]|uniref:BAG family molecular chaperone regulator 2 n=1 Tax=Bactrocera dorsalis TaxID=27457 RepID=A0A034W0P1_BACDO|nr:BAG family molecular chaperone regulator 2 isoform X1 [Bactrocera dorsalis]XP_011208024.1 BAG family molecular chaperone regulator 2 isoform X1 [Bactrocera dorsalis]XP_011208025.1 BAG family molecular chaperone regulator 2 isoform X1 [Bactrocera dorsalis]XP_019847044.1 BAG family molecular chaperone regulator 2 isoform X1 [Bactrocera dorsalis]XP_039967105.1 BAG family molecular chaperone regulator 2 isoform X3 [Bactrocera tryoni]XP_039967106.1 BAG family molecular chaperone regulator 2 isof
MDIDSTPVPPPQEYSDNPAGYQSESSMNFDYLHGLNDAAARASSSASSLGGHVSFPETSRHFSDLAGGGIDVNASSTQSYGYVDDSKALDRPFNLNERFVSVLDQLDARVEKFRKDALGLQEKKDFLLMSIDLIKSHDMLHSMMEAEREEIFCYIQRVNARLSTVDLLVHTVRDRSQEDALSQINALIDMMITIGDPVLSRQRCQQYLNACCSAAEASSSYEYGVDMDAGPVDKKFESALLGCTLDDQKNIKKRLQALMGYLNKQTIRN